MFKYQPELSNFLLFAQFIAALVAISYANKLKGTFWLWFVVYLVYVIVIEKFGNIFYSFFNIDKHYFFAYFGIPIQFVFFYWLYALKSLKNKALFWGFLTIYLLSFIPVELYFSQLKVVYSVNYVVGTLLLMNLVFLEFKKQITTDAILDFSKNKMFYINFGVMFFYVGTLPFFGFYNIMLKNSDIWNLYYIYFLVSNSVMYILFAASFIWGRVK